MLYFLIVFTCYQLWRQSTSGFCMCFFSQFVMCNELILLETFWLINKRCTPGIVTLNLNLPGVEVALILETDEGQSIQANFTYFYHR